MKLLFVPIEACLDDRFKPQGDRFELAKQRLENELSIAAEIQRGLLPDQLPVLEGLQVSAASETSRVIGGDYFDVIRLDEHRTLFAIADVAGKGIPAALLMANVQAALNVLAWSDLPLTSLAEQINTLVCQNTEPEGFITMFLAVINAQTRGIEYVNAGHNPPILIHDVIDDLCRQASAIAPRIADESLDAGCTNERPTGPRQAEAFRLVETAFALNAVTA